MKKVISALLLVSMIAAMFVVGVSAVEGTAINTAEEFAGITGEGKYYLAADITLTATNENEFTGTLDGNGKTITTSVPVFAKAGGTIKNLTIAGELAAGKAVLVLDTAAALALENCVNNAKLTNSGSATGVFVGTVSHDLTIKKCTNNGDANTTSTNGCGGFIGSTAADGVKVTIEDSKNTGKIESPTQASGFIALPKNAIVVIKNCVNEGNIDAIKNKKNYTVAAGFIGRAQATDATGETASFTIENCKNTGTLSSVGQYAGGMAAWIDKGKVSIKNCVNTGDVSASHRVGGIIGNVGADKSYQAYEITGCVNSGKISGGERIGGIVGCVYGQGNRTTERVAAGTCQYAVITNCINLGEVVTTGAANAGQIIGHQDSECLVLKNCIAAGKITIGETTGRGVIVGCSGEIMIGGERTLSDGTTKETTPGCDLENVYLIENDGTTWFSFQAADKDPNCTLEAYMAMADKAGDIIIVTADKLASGEVAYALNQAIGSTVFYQTIGTDKVPTLDSSSKVVIKEGDKYVNDKAPVNPPDNPPVNPGTGDEVLVWVVALIVSAIGACVVIRRKEEL